MKLTVINSGSASNGYVIHNDNEAVVLECGCPLIACEKVLHFNVKKVSGVFVTHEHKDHAGFITDYSKYMPIYASEGTLKACGCLGVLNCNSIPMLKTIHLGRFSVLAFPTEHDASQPCGFLIYHPEVGNILFATDTYYVKYKFKQLSYIMLEANYDRKILDHNVQQLVIPLSVRNRVLKSHMSIDTCIDTLRANDLSSVNGIVLIHLSGNNSNREDFVQRVRQETGKFCVAAERGLEIELIK